MRTKVVVSLVFLFAVNNFSATQSGAIELFLRAFARDLCTDIQLHDDPHYDFIPNQSCMKLAMEHSESGPYAMTLHICEKGIVMTESACLDKAYRNLTQDGMYFRSQLKNVVGRLERDGSLCSTGDSNSETRRLQCLKKAFFDSNVLYRQELGRPASEPIKSSLHLMNPRQLRRQI